jgi:hypothetical protein
MLLTLRRGTRGFPGGQSLQQLLLRGDRIASDSSGQSGLVRKAPQGRLTTRPLAAPVLADVTGGRPGVGIK